MNKIEQKVIRRIKRIKIADARINTKKKKLPVKLVEIKFHVNLGNLESILMQRNIK